MINCTIDKEKSLISVKAAGTTEQLTMECLALISSMHNSIKENDPDMAAWFRQVLTAAMIYPDPENPVWKDE